MDAGVEEVPLGLYLVKGDMMCVPRSTPILPRLTAPCPLQCAHRRIGRRGRHGGRPGDDSRRANTGNTVLNAPPGAADAI
jgi:hypothetical protein